MSEQNASRDLVESWIARLSEREGSPEYERHWWSYPHVEDLCENHPDAAWAFILSVLAVDQSKTILENLSAGPLEDLLAKHGATVIERVEAESRRNPAFAKLLGGVWQNTMPADIWDRVRRVWNRRGWDGIPE